MELPVDLSKCDHLQVVRGFPFPKLKTMIRENIESAMDYRPKDGDIIVDGYPKTGTTWLQYIVMQILSKVTDWHNLISTMSKVLEYIGKDKADALDGHRWYKTHMPYYLLHTNYNTKYIYIYRHPEDALVSFHHFYNEVVPYKPIDFDQFFDYFMSGNVWYGSYFNHVMSFYAHRGDPNLLMVSYEKLLEDKKGSVLNIAKFIGEDHYAYLVQHQGVLDKIMERTSFDYMKKNLTLSIAPEYSSYDVTYYPTYFRKGAIGTGKAELSENQRQALKRKAESILKETTIFQEWYGEPDDP